ncbi:DsrE family protein [Pseudomaricurvus sp. HS19]|uniref:DsrE family protein n=1 Tax=Pseudomaricurvus sp. HS19 TaxID=2692626 RepID=UPI00136D9C0F|nr:DsrE family protein [Pseudomaricurvus sp. HS19]MYM62205.1 hypothetical protein [Pseudomaricurvus sp. HS19]
MLFSLLVSRPPSPDPQYDQALQLATAILNDKHRLYRVFFVASGVSTACPGTGCTGSATTQAWVEIQQQHQLDLVVCVTDYQQRYGKEPCNSGFTLSGMGQLADASHCSDRLITIR